VIEAQKAGHLSGFFCNNPKLTDKCDPEMTSSQVNKEALLQQVWRAIRSQDLKQAITCSNKLNGTFPDFAPGWHASSHLAQMVNQPRKALLAIDRALKLESGRADWHLHRAACLLKCGESDSARQLLGQLVAQTNGGDRTKAAQLSQLAFLCSRVEMHDEAADLYLMAIRQEPENGGHWYNLATIQRFRGQAEAAESSLDKAIELNNKDYDAYQLRSDLRRQTRDSNHVAELEQILADGVDKPAGEVRLSYALAKELEDIGESARSFEALDRGATLRRKHINYRIEDDLKTIEAIQSAFDATLFERGIKGHSSQAPVFIIGLPRTGTTLAERIIGSHSEVFAAGELNSFALQMTQQLRERTGDQPLSREQQVQQTASLDFERLGQAYLDSTRPLTGSSPHFVDKMPLNFLYAGLIHLSLPGAKIIHLTRHPMDTCYAIYKRLFQDAYPWSYDLGEVARYYLAYHQLMAHWKRVMPGVIYDLAYEKLVTDTESQARNLIAHCNLPWQAQCLRFHKQSQTSTTASASQVRLPVYDTSVGLWRNYAKQLEPLTHILREHGIEVQ
jgi:tetratricopeptide (TPR) repeat protein